MIAVLLALACSTPSAPSGEDPSTSGMRAVPPVAELPAWVEGHTYQSDRITLEFLEGAQARMSWKRMKGDPVMGTVKVKEDALQVDWEEARNTLNQIYRLEPTDGCTLSLVYQLRKVGGEITDPVPFHDLAEGCPGVPEPEEPVSTP